MLRSKAEVKHYYFVILNNPNFVVSISGGFNIFFGTVGTQTLCKRFCDKF